MKSTELTPEQLAEIEEFAYKYLSREEIALVLELPDPTVFDDEESPVFVAFWKGRLKRKAKFNASIIELSDQLSSPAQAIEIKLAEKTALNDKKKVMIR